MKLAVFRIAHRLYHGHACGPFDKPRRCPLCGCWWPLSDSKGKWVPFTKREIEVMDLLEVWEST